MEEKEVVVEEVVEETVVEEAPVAETPVATEDTTSKPAMEVPGNKFALIAFILSVVAIGGAVAWLGSFVGVIVGIVGLVMLKKAGADRKPFSVFERVAKPLCIVSIILGAVMFVTALLVTLIPIIIAAVGEVIDSTYALALFAL